jgi:hypothetical protein
MKLVFSDSPNIDELTFKRLLLLGDEIAFVERPSIQFIKDLGTVGMPSGIRGLLPQFESAPVKLRVEEPPNTVFSSGFYQQYFKTDIANPEFISTVIEGIRNRWFYSHFFEPEKNRATKEFKDFHSWILNNQEEISQTDLNSVDLTGFHFEINNKNNAYQAVKMIMSEESLRVTSVTHISNKIASNPTSINPYLDKLINLRLSSELYTGKSHNSRSLGMKLFQSMIPDEALLKIPVDEILSFREDTKKYYEAWTIEINRLEARLAKEGFALSDKDIQNIIDTEINPKLFELKNEIRRVRDKKFADILKVVKNNVIAVIAGGTLSAINLPAAILGFITTNLKTPKLTDDIIDNQFKLKDIKDSNGLTYLLKLNEKIERE